MENRETGGAALLDAPGAREHPEECLYKGRRPGCTRGTPAGCPLEEPEPEEGAGGCIYDRCGGCPCEDEDFEPSEELLEAIEEAEAMEADPSLGKSYATAEDMMADIFGDEWKPGGTHYVRVQAIKAELLAEVQAELLADAGS